MDQAVAIFEKSVAKHNGGFSISKKKKQFSNSKWISNLNSINRKLNFSLFSVSFLQVFECFLWA